MFRRSLICTDFSDGLHRLTRFVPSLAASGMQQIVFLHTAVISPEREVPRIDDDEIQSLRDRLVGALTDVPDGIEVKVEVQPGRPIDTILRVSQEQRSDLIVVGMAGQNLLQEKLFGSTTMELCQRTTIPIVTLRPQLISTYTTEELDLRCRHLFRYLLLPYDGSDSANYLISRVRAISKDNPERSLEHLLLCWVFEEQGRRSLPREYDESSAQEQLSQVAADLQTLGLQVDSEIREGNPLSELLEAALERDIGAIAISSNTPNRLLGWSVPSFAQEILRRSWHPVIYFPPERR
jgi:nucleotide-binding universal stress UspA family protein